jgi:hypothetical protein
VRLCDEIPMTGTFKLARAALARQGIDVEVDKGQLWVNDAITQQFRLCDTHLREKIKLGAVRI